IKRDTPVMCVIGNPPYSVSSSNKSEWIEKLTADYKKDLNERNIQPLSDDYIKFIRFGQHFIDKNGSGVLAYISNNSFIDGKIHRQMRKFLLQTFDKIYVLDLHGSTMKNENSNGRKDENVFDIQQGVSINIFIKTERKKKGELAEVNHYDLLGRREEKYDFLSSNTFNKISWQKLAYKEPNFFFVPKNFEFSKLYFEGFQVSELFIQYACGVVTARDSLLIQNTKKEIEGIKEDFINLDEITFRKKYDEHNDSRDWTYLNARKEVVNSSIEYVDYRPFDKRLILFSPKSKGILSYPRNEIMKHMISEKNIGLLICKQQSTYDFQHIFITNCISDKCSVSLQTKEASYHFPLYLIKEKTSIDQVSDRSPNLAINIAKEIAENLSLTFTPETDPESEVCFCKQCRSTARV
ncbi:MAG: type ISP restriction/modification enzyme, partial [Segetibacter sp.]